MLLHHRLFWLPSSLQLLLLARDTVCTPAALLQPAAQRAGMPGLAAR
jgi:hypothetical protein